MTALALKLLAVLVFVAGIGSLIGAGLFALATIRVDDELGMLCGIVMTASLLVIGAALLGWI